MTSFLASADGWYPSDEFLHLNEPSQKAIITWDGETETMILSAAVKSGEIANFAWIVPIQSYTEPKVTEGNISIFKDLVDYFKVERPHHYGKDVAGVEVLETKEIDVYDVSILKANSADDLISWLKQNGYKVPDNAESVISYYIKKGNTYFVANKIDLRNKYADIVDFLKNFGLGEVDPSYKPVDASTYRVTDEILRMLKYPEERNEVSERLTKYILSNNPYEKPLSRNWIDFLFVSKDEYNNLKNQYAFDFDERLQERMINVMNYAEKYDSISLYCSYNGNVNKVYLYGNGEGEDIYFSSCDSLINDFESLDNVKNELSKISWNDVKKRYGTVKERITWIIDGRLKKISHMEDRLQEFYQEEKNLKNGVATPLKFEFKPKELYYPLRISSLNSGYGNIEVYVISETPVKDKNGVLEIDSIKSIDIQLKNNLEKFIPVSGGYVTRLTYKGDLEKLNDNAVFIEPDQPLVMPPQGRTNFIEIMSNLIVLIFRSLWPF